MNTENTFSKPDEDTYRQLIAQIAEARISKNWTQYELATRAGVAHTTIMRIESLEYKPLLPTFLKILEALGLELCLAERTGD